MISNISAFAQSREYGKGVIHMVQGKVEICGVNTSKLPVVKSTQQDQFFERIKQGDEHGGLRKRTTPLARGLVHQRRIT